MATTAPTALPGHRRRRWWPTRRATCGSRTSRCAAPAPDEAVVEVAYGGICGSDLHYWLHGAAGESILKAPLVLGHEIVGHRGPCRGGRHRPRGRHRRSRCIRPRPGPGGGAGTRRTGPTCPRAAPTWAAPRASRTPTARSAATSTCRPGCSGRCRRAWTCGPRRWSNRPASPGTPCPGPGTWPARPRW